jgi:hypothetical protein
MGLINSASLTTLMNIEDRAIDIPKPEPKTKGARFIVKDHIYVDANGKIVPKGKDAVTKKYVKGQPIPMAEAQRLGLANFNPDDALEGSTKHVAAPVEDKAITAPEKTKRRRKSK